MVKGGPWQGVIYMSLLTLSLSWPHLKNDQQKCKIWNPWAFFFFALARERIINENTQYQE